MEQLRRRKMNPHLGVEIDCASLDLAQPLGRAGAQSLFQSLMEHKVVALRNTGLTTAVQHQELVRQVQICSLANVEGVFGSTSPHRPPETLGTDDATELFNEIPGDSPFGSTFLPEARGVQRIGPWPSKNGGAIGNAVWHSDREHPQHPSWFTSLRMAQIPKDPETGEVLPCGDTMFADMTVAYDDLPESEKEEYRALKAVFDWRVALPHFKKRIRDGVPGYKERYEYLCEKYPPVERPVVRPHPVTGRLALKADPSYISHIVGKTKEESEAILQRIARLCEVPEYQLRLPWRSEGDVIILDNYVLCHRVVADFYDIPKESRTLENCATKGYPSPHNVLVPGADVDDTRNPHHEDVKQERAGFSSSAIFEKSAKL